MTEKRRDEIAAPAIVARIKTLRRAWMLSEDCLDILVMASILETGSERAQGIQGGQKEEENATICVDSVIWSLDVEHSNLD